MTLTGASRGYVKALQLLAQRCGGRAPEPVRRVLRRVLGPVLSGQPVELEGWGLPLSSTPAEEPERGRPSDVLHDLPLLPSPREEQPTREVTAGSRLRCLLATGSLDVGGMDEVVAFLARRLPAHGVDVAVLVAAPGGSGPAWGHLAQRLLEEGVQVDVCQDADVLGRLEDWAPDVVSGHGASAAVLAAANHLGVPYVDTLHGMHDLMHVGSDEERRRSAGLVAIVAVSELVKRQYLRLNPSYDHRAVHVVPNTVDDDGHARVDRTAARHALGLQDEFLWVCLARHCLQKNTYGLVRAFVEVARATPDAHLVIAGRCDDAAYFEQVRRLVVRTGLSGRVHLRGHVSHPAALLAAADGFVLDSFFEGWSLASMEALYAGVPVVLSEVGGAEEQVRDARCGVLVGNPLGDAERLDWDAMSRSRFRDQPNRAELVTAMLAISQDRVRWRAARQRLADESSRRFAPTAGVQRHAALLQVLASASPPRTSAAPRPGPLGPWADPCQQAVSGGPPRAPAP